MQEADRVAGEPLGVIVYSDFLCPWCHVGAVRMRDLEEEFGAAIRLEWKSFLLRPDPQPGRSLERFQAYTPSWRRPAEEEPRARFQVWQSDAGPPSHSVPPHLVAKAAAELGDPAFRRLRDALFRAYFAESRDITDDATLRDLWCEAELPEAEFERRGDPALLRRVRDDHREAIEMGATGVPALRLAGSDFTLVGAQPIEIYRRWLRRNLAGDASSA